ncbi:flagellar export chaperone FliS [Opitutaceae bacterium TAV4]|uniref:flagellar export chaperone FliS n=1 Tax=Geminisphaera colitermitum TaxID=1148786 RepID=UPI0005BD172A|nr:flagellar export chaperone FliS [Geminisphaera colitermitum]RRJ96247.1 flagellar export chaperone FliS [Opitutaceae bacterium TAV4]RRK00393.1 flagellar export chaperone FliS [Opitutaceae bacterium TAV3]
MLPTAQARLYQRQSILTASPGQLVVMLYDGALRFMALARENFKLPATDHHRIEHIHNALLRAQAILRELQATLNHDAGGEVAANLDRLYDYHIRRLDEANRRKDEAPIIEVEHLVGQLRDAWAEMLRNNFSF